MIYFEIDSCCRADFSCTDNVSPNLVPRAIIVDSGHEIAFLQSLLDPVVRAIYILHITSTISMIYCGNLDFVSIS